MTRQNLNELNVLLREASAEGLPIDEVLKVVDIVIAIQPYADEFEQYRKELLQKLSLTGLDNIMAAIQQGIALTDEQSATMKTYMESAHPVLLAKGKEEVEIELPTIKKESFAQLMQLHHWKFGAHKLFQSLIEG